jgi:hypothetical protein
LNRKSKSKTQLPFETDPKRKVTTNQFELEQLAKEVLKQKATFFPQLFFTHFSSFFGLVFVDELLGGIHPRYFQWGTSIINNKLKDRLLVLSNYRVYFIRRTALGKKKVSQTSPSPSFPPSDARLDCVRVASCGPAMDKDNGCR